MSKHNRRNGTRVIGIFGANVGNGNLGDEATFEVVLNAIRRKYSQSDVCAICSNPDDTEKRYHITAISIGSRRKPKEQLIRGCVESAGIQEIRIQERLANAIKERLRRKRFVFVPLKSAYAVFSGFVNGVFEFGRELGFYVRGMKFTRRMELVVFAGSGALSDHYGGPMNFPYSLFKWSVLSKIAGAKIAFVSVGAGPIDFLSSKILLKWALCIADYRSFRDQESKKLVENLGVKGNNQVFPDLVQGLKIDGSQKVKNKSMKNVVGINPFPHYWNTRDPESYQRYVGKIALFASWLIENRYRVVLFPTHLHGDWRVIDEIRGKIIACFQEEYKVDPLERPIRSVSDLIHQISVLDLVVATRFHGIMLSFLLNKPVIGISNQPKMDSLMRDMGQGEYLFDLESFDVETLKQRFLTLEANGDRIKRTLKPIISGYREALKKQYEEVFKLVKFGKVPGNDCNTNRLNVER